MYLLCDMAELKRKQFELFEGQVEKAKPAVKELYGYTTLSAYLRDHLKEVVKKHERKQSK